jgi:pyruvate/2-oxoglutarate dehydrogenase complex dihydrolipoamide dehydrogenase (E3) component
MSEVVNPDICVVGAGSAGLTVAAAAAAFGVPVALVEKNRMGGDCLNTGCVPSKALIAAARHMRMVREGVDFGVSAGSVDVDFPAVMGHVREVIAAIEPNDSAERFTGLGVTVIRGPARFRDKRTVLVGGTEISARRFVLATGARPAIPAIPGLDAVGYLTSETVFDLPRRPTHLIVIGAGAMGLELAQAFRRLGSAVTVLEAGKALGKDDPELAALLLETLRAEGVEILENVAVSKVAKRGRAGVRLTIGEAGGAARIVDGSHLLVAAGRRPDCDGMDLAAAGVAFDESGIKVDRRLRTTNPLIYAIGDVTGGPQFTHWASYQAGLVIRSILFRFGGKVNDDLLPWVTFTDPELAHVGLTEEQARARHRGVQVLRWPFSENDRAHAERATRGLVKVIASRRGRILGVDILGRGAGELLAPFVVAIQQGADVKSLATAVFPYPTLSEAARRAAISYYAPKLASPWVRRTIRFLRKFG